MPAVRCEAGVLLVCRTAFEWVAKLQRAFPGDERAVWTQTSLAALVDAAAQSPEAADAAYFTLEGMHGAVSPINTSPQCYSSPRPLGTRVRHWLQGTATARYASL